MPATCTLIAKTTLGAAATSIEFGAIPSTFTDLVLVCNIRTDRAAYAETLQVTFNGSTTGYTARMLSGYATGAESYTQSVPYLGAFFVNSASSTASTFGNAEMYISNYAGSSNKAVSATSVTETNSATASQAFIGAYAGLWSNTAPITSIRIVPSFGPNFVAGSSAFLYGVTNASGSPGTFMDASGGDVTISGGYKYHVFRSSGVLQVNTPGWAEVLVVAGGGGGGRYWGGGGGGGGYVASVSMLPIGPHSVTVGAGGAGGASSSGANGSNGVDSSLGSIVALGGGFGGGSTGAAAGGQGGSGGGAGGSGAASGGAGLQGFAGGSKTTGAGGAGGGGGGAVGQSLTANGGGNGGVGFVSPIPAAGTYYSGGGGGSFGTPGTGGTGGGGNGATDSTPSTSGGVNTGGGGGGGSNPNAAGSGGSGIVIVRYPYR